MGITLTLLASGKTATTSSVNPAAGSKILVAAASAWTGGGSVTHTFSGVASSYVEIKNQGYAGRRGVTAAVGSGSFTEEAITINSSGTGSHQETFYYIWQVEGYDETTFNNTAVSGVGSTSPLTSSDVGTPDANDVVFAIAAFEDGGSSFTLDSATTATILDSGVNVRSLHTGYDGTGTPDETPAATWTGTGNEAAIIAFIINAAAGGTIDCTTDALVLTEGTATITKAYDVNCTTDALTLTENVATITKAYDLATTTDALTLTENKATLGYTLETSGDALVLTENVASVDLLYEVNTVQASLAITENRATIDYSLTCTVAALTLTENRATLLYDLLTVVDALILTEGVADIDTGSGVINCTTATLTLTENRAIIGYTLETSTDALILTENAATIVTSGAGTIETTTAALVLTANIATIVQNLDLATIGDSLSLATSKAIITKRPPNYSPLLTSNSLIRLNLNNVPQVEDRLTYEALLDIHNALQHLLAELNDRLGFK